jgi:hypothetical protein
MEKEQRTRLQKATQDARRLLEEEFRSQLLQTYDIDVEKVRWAEEPGAHLLVEQRLIREKLIAWIEHKEAQINDRKEALLLALREMAFTALNRFVALKLMEARELVRPCVTGGLESAGFLEFTAVAQGLLADQESSYRLFLETIFEDVSRELRALFDPRDPASLLWPKRAALLELLDILNRPELDELWTEDETLGWVYQYFNGDAERKKMREESAAPRNSRELAVRNQFFTPRYVVEFLTDNTLGSIWYEMRQGNTSLKDRCSYLAKRHNEAWLQPEEEPPAEPVTKEALSQEELVRQPVHIPYRELKDPREIRMLDPACGSMHFGLYAFDLYLAIYEECWEIAKGSHEQARQCEAFAPFVEYAAGFTDKAGFLLEIPRLILEHNIHGIDIDPRATQIARLTLWLRAQRAWQEQQLEVAARPPITRSNVVCAEPMPGERELLGDFVDQQFPEAERGLVQQLLEAIFDKMQLAGEAGSLLKIEEEIRDAINQARKEWQKLEIQQRNLFSAAELAALGQVGSSLNYDLQNLTKNFWVNVEERIYVALRDYANQTKSGGYQRRMFAEDAAQGFAFIDVCRKRYDVALMNPPFGQKAAFADVYFRERYPLTCVDYYSMFFEHALSLLGRGGKVGAISNRTWLALPSFEPLRTRIFGISGCVEIAADLGSFVLDAQVETIALVAAAGFPAEKKGLWIRLLKTKAKDELLLASLNSLSIGERSNCLYTASHTDLSRLPSSVFGYWMSSRLVSLYRPDHSLASSNIEVKVGSQTSDDFRFLRLAWECRCCDIGIGSTWARFAKGGEYQSFYDDIYLLVKWDGGGREIAAFPASSLKNLHLNGVAGVTWPMRTTSQFGPRALPAGCVFGHKGPAAFPNDEISPFLLLGYLASGPAKLLLSVRLGAADDAPGSASKSYEVGLIRDLPFSDFRGKAQALEDLAEEAADLVRSLAVQDDETTALFSIPVIAGLANEHNLRNAAALVFDRREQTLARLAVINAQIDDLVADALCFDEPDREVLWEELERPLVTYPVDNTAPAELFTQAYLTKQSIPGDLLPGGLDAETDVRVQTRRKQQVTLRGFESICRLFEIHPDRFLELRRNLGLVRQEDLYSLSGSLISYCIGCAFGRWDVRLASGGRSAPKHRNPFALLPSCAPGLLQDDTGLPLQQEQLDADYPLTIAWNGVLVTDPGHPFDLLGKVQEALTVIFPGRDQAFTQEAISFLGASTLDEFILGSSTFFADHLKRYSKSRRQAPIYWQISAGDNSYSAWLYYHRFTQDSLYRVLRDFVEPRIQQAEREQFELESQGALSGDAAVRLQEAQTLLQDLRILKSELDLVAPLWNPNLNDGVIINHAILWRITPYTPWQKKCKECWDKLVKGDYDWAHLAFHLWPERVIPKCTTDRSLAIAHGLEERLWQETNNGNWLPRQLSETELQALIAEHSNPAVKSALERFLAAPPPVAPTRTRASRSTRSNGSSAPRRPRGTTPVVDAEATRQVLLALTAAPSDGLAKAAIADLIGVEANALTAVIKQLKEIGQIEQLGAARGARYRLSETGRAAVEQVEAG